MIVIERERERKMGVDVALNQRSPQERERERARREEKRRDDGEPIMKPCVCVGTRVTVIGGGTLRVVVGSEERERCDVMVGHHEALA